MASIGLNGLTKVYDGEIAAVRDVNLDVRDGEFMVIVGPSGCGKTTLLRLIAGLEQPVSGTVRIGERSVNNVAPRDRDAAMVFQNFALYPHLTVYENMAFALKLRKCPKDEIDQRVRGAAKLLDIEPLLGRKPGTLSGGQRQRVALGRAIARKPSVFLFDEPLSNLDAKLRMNMRAELKSLHKRLAVTSIYVTHDQAEAMTLGERICVMCDGRVQQTGKPLEVYKAPANKFVAGFLGSPPMNFFQGRIESQQGLKFVSGNGEFSLPVELEEKLAGCNDNKVILGIRPEDFSLRPIDGDQTGQISGTVEMIEQLGNKTIAHIRDKDGHRFTAPFESDSSIQTGKDATFYINPRRIHIFDTSQIGRNLGIDTKYYS